MLYVPGLLAGRLSGKAGNTLASSGPYGQTITVSRNAKSLASPLKSTAQGSFATIVKSYRALSPSDLAAWKALGLTMFVTGRLNRTFQLTGLGAFLSVNRFLNTIGQPYVTTAPALLRPASIALSSLTAVGPVPGGGSLSLETAPGPIPADTWLVVKANGLTSTSIQSQPRQSWKIIDVIPPLTVGPFDLTTAYENTFQGFATGEQIALMTFPVNNLGFAGANASISAIAS